MHELELDTYLDGSPNPTILGLGLRTKRLKRFCLIDYDNYLSLVANRLPLPHLTLLSERGLCNKPRHKNIQSRIAFAAAKNVRSTRKFAN